MMKRTAIITGASSGLGAGVAEVLARSGHNLVISGRSADRLSEVAKAARAHGSSVIEVVSDVTDNDFSNTLVKETVGAFGTIDVLINNAGIFTYASPVDTDMEDFDRQFAVNVRAPFELTKFALPHMSKGSAILFVGSNLAHYGMPGTSAYSAAKAAVEAMTRTLAVELGPDGIRVNAISPGLTRTPMTAGITGNDQALSEAIAASPVGRLGEVEDIAETMAFLCSESAGYINGAVLIIDGGRHLR